MGAVAALLTLWAAPAFAADPVTITAPAADAVLDTATVVVTGTAAVDPALGLPLATLDSVTVTIGSKTVTAAGCSGKTSCTYKETFTLPLNGPYTVEVVATPKGLLAGDASTKSQSFAVSVAPATPVVDPPKITDGRTVELSWSRNTEPDMLYYAVFRKDPGGSTFLPVSGKVAQPASGAKVTFTDASTSTFNGGDYSYRVVAVRKGPTGTDKSEAKSAASAAVAATVPVPTTTSSTVAPPAAPGTPAAGPAPTTTAKPGTSAGVDLSGFLSSRSKPVALPPITVPEPPDTGFQNTLPFGARPPGADVEEGDAEATQPNRGAASIVSITTGRPLVPVAGGLVLLLLALHLRLLGRRVKSGADRDLPVDRTVPTPRVAPRPPPAPADEPTLVGAGAWALEAETEAPAAPSVPAPAADADDVWRPAAGGTGPVAADPDEIEVFEVVSSNRRRLARAGTR